MQINDITDIFVATTGGGEIIQRREDTAVLVLRCLQAGESQAGGSGRKIDVGEHLCDWSARPHGQEWHQKHRSLPWYGTNLDEQSVHGPSHHQQDHDDRQERANGCNQQIRAIRSMHTTLSLHCRLHCPLHTHTHTHTYTDTPSHTHCLCVVTSEHTFAIC